MNKLPGFTSESSIYKSNNRYLANYSMAGMSLSSSTVSPARQKMRPAPRKCLDIRPVFRGRNSHQTAYEECGTCDGGENMYCLLPQCQGKGLDDWKCESDFESIYPIFEYPRYRLGGLSLFR